MSEQHVQEVIDHRDMSIEQNSGSLAMFCDPAVILLSPSARAQLGHEAEGEIFLLMMIGQLRELDIPTEVPNTAKNGGPPQMVQALIGDWEVSNITTGEIFKPHKMYLPRGFHERRCLELRAHLADGIEGPLEIGGVWSVFLRPNATPPNTPYSWRWHPHTAARKADPLASLRKKSLVYLRADRARPVNPALEHLAEIPQPMTIDNREFDQPHRGHAEEAE